TWRRSAAVTESACLLHAVCLGSVSTQTVDSQAWAPGATGRAGQPPRGKKGRAVMPTNCPRARIGIAALLSSADGECGAATSHRRKTDDLGRQLWSNITREEIHANMVFQPVVLGVPDAPFTARRVPSSPHTPAPAWASTAQRRRGGTSRVLLARWW